MSKQTKMKRKPKLSEGDFRGRESQNFQRKPKLSEGDIRGRETDATSWRKEELMSKFDTVSKISKTRTLTTTLPGAHQLASRHNIENYRTRSGRTSHKQTKQTMRTQNLITTLITLEKEYAAHFLMIIVREGVLDISRWRLKHHTVNTS